MTWRGGFLKQDLEKSLTMKEKKINKLVCALAFLF